MKKTQKLVQNKTGINVCSPYASRVWEGQKTKIVEPRLYQSQTNKLLYLLEDNSRCYGVIILKNPEKIDASRFKELYDEHLLSEDQKEKWWPHKEVLYAYDVESVVMFKNPFNIESCKDDTKVIKNFEFTDKEQEMIEDISSYDPSQSTNQQLEDDWRIVMAWYSTKKSGGKIKHSLEQIINIARLIYLEIKRRVRKGEMEHEFRPEKMDDESRELFNIVREGRTGLKTNSEAPAEPDLSKIDLDSTFDDSTIIKDFISVIGSVAEKPHNHKPDDIDLLVRMEQPPDYMKRAIETRLKKKLSLPHKAHVVWGDEEGPHDSYIPLYDLKLSRVKPLKKIEMKEQQLSVSIEPFKPMKPGKRFYRPEELIDWLWDDSKNKEYMMEKKFDGFRGILIKENDTVKIYSEQKEDYTSKFGKIVSEAKNLGPKDLVLDGEIVHPGGRYELTKYVQDEDAEISEDKIEFYAFDCVYYDGEWIDNKSWEDRKQNLHSLNFSDHIKEVESIKVENKSDSEKTLEMLRGLDNSEGAVVKATNSKYEKDSESEAWVKFRNTDELNVKILDRNDTEHGYTYLFGIDIPKDQTDKFRQDHIVNGKTLELNRTFVTEDKFSEGDIITVRVEEVWRHKYPNDKIHYSVHKPKVVGKSDSDSTTPWKEIDKIVVSKGEEIVEKENSQGGDCSNMVDAEEVMDKSLTNIRDLAGYKKIAVIDRGEQGHYWIAFANDEYFIVDEGVVVWRSSDNYPKLAKKEWENRTKNMKGEEKKYAEFYEETTSDEGVGGKSQGETVKSPDDQGEEASDSKYWDERENASGATTTSTPGVSGVQGTSFPRKKPVRPKKYWDAVYIKDKDKKKIMQQLSEELHPRDRQELSEVFYNIEGEDKEEESETRQDAATEFWNENWHDMYPKDGRGKFVYQHHWRGLTEEQSKMSDEELLETDNSLHGDFRGEVNDEELWGFTCFLGEASDNKEKNGDKLIYLSNHTSADFKIQGTWKLSIPHSWLEVGTEEGGLVSEPGGVASTSKKWAKFFAKDTGTYEMGVWRKHFYEIFVNGDKLKGRMLIMYAPVGGSRKWLLDFPEDQTPYAEQNKKEDVIKEIKNKEGQGFLIWAKPGEKPEKIDVSKWEPKED